MIFPWHFKAFSQISRYNFPLFHMAFTSFDSLILLIDGDNHLKSTGLWFSKILGEIFPDIKYIGWGLKNGILPHHYSATLKKLKSVSTITEILIFPGFLSFFHDVFQNLKVPWYFHDWKSYSHFSRFSRFPGAVGTLNMILIQIG